jgi:hypothetical protein
MTVSLPTRMGVETSLASRERLTPGWVGVQSSPNAASTREVLPTAQFVQERRIVPPWVPAASKRIAELSSRRKGWDSYDGEPMQPGAVVSVGLLIAEFGHALQTNPVISLTGDGGVLLEWENEQASLEYATFGDASAHVYYSEPSGREWEGPAAECVMLEKWLWRASGRPADTE